MKKMHDNIHVDVCGKRYTVPREMFESGPSSRLSRMYKEESLNTNPECICINRPEEGFLALLSFYQTGELHMPMTSCPVAFLNELEYWEILPDALSECCIDRLRSYLSDKETVRAFKEDQKIAENTKPKYLFLNEYRSNIWDIVEFTKPTLLGKIYFAMMFLMVLVSILVMAYSTDPNFRRAMTNCERLDYMHSSGMEDYDMMKPYLEEICEEVIIPSKFTNVSGNTKVTIEKQGSSETDNLSFEVHKQYIDDGLFPKETEFVNKTIPTDFSEEDSNNDSFINNSANVSQTKIVNRSDDLLTNPLFYINEVFVEPTKKITIPNFKSRAFVLVILDGIASIFFTIDIVIRLLTCPIFVRYVVSVINWADILSVLGLYGYLCLYYMFPHLRYGSWIDNLTYVQILRSLRFFRIAVNVRAGKVMWYTIRKNIKDLSVLALFLVMGMLTFSSCFYITEKDQSVNSIPDSWYWAIITMTTVGYGDIQPESNAGRLIACVCAVSGVLVLALTVPIFANHFLLLYQYADSENNVTKFQNSQTRRNFHKDGNS